MLKRLEGAVMIVNTLMPVIVILGITALGWAFVHTIRDAARDPLARIDASIVRMDATIVEARQAAGVLTYAVIEGVAKPIKATADAIGAIPASIRIDIPNIKIPNARLPIKPNVAVNARAGIPPVDVRVWMTDLNVSMPTIPGIRLPETRIPGLHEVKNALTDVFGIFARVVDVLKQIASIGTLGEEVTAVLAATADLVTAVRASTVWILTVARALLYLGIAWFLLSYAMWAHRRLRIGWALVRGVD
jgi:hypothetical protein